MNTYTNKYNCYNRVYALLRNELKRSKITDIDFILGAEKTCINKINNRYLLQYNPYQIIALWNNNTFYDYKSRILPRKFSLKNFMRFVLLHELAHKIKGDCESKAYQNITKIGKLCIIYDEYIQNRADNYALNCLLNKGIKQ